MNLNKRLCFAAILLLASATHLPAQDVDDYLKRLPQENGVLYFVKPVEFKQGPQKFRADFTYLDHKDSTRDVTLNFSLITRTPLRKIDKLELRGPSGQVAALTPRLMYQDQEGKDWIGRFTLQVKPEDFLSWLKAGEQASLRLSTAQEIFVFRDSRDLKKTSEALYELLRMNWQSTE